jgi:hypothetical protein
MLQRNGHPTPPKTIYIQKSPIPSLSNNHPLISSHPSGTQPGLVSASGRLNGLLSSLMLMLFWFSLGGVLGLSRNMMERINIMTSMKPQTDPTITPTHCAVDVEEGSGVPYAVEDGQVTDVEVVVSNVGKVVVVLMVVASGVAVV